MPGGTLQRNAASWWFDPDRLEGKEDVEEKIQFQILSGVLSTNSVDGSHNFVVTEWQAIALVSAILSGTLHSSSKVQAKTKFL